MKLEVCVLSKSYANLVIHINVPIPNSNLQVLNSFSTADLVIGIILYHFRMYSEKKLATKTLIIKWNLCQSGYVPIHYGIFTVLGNFSIIH